MKLKITKDANGLYTLYRVDTNSWFSGYPRKGLTRIASSNNAGRLLDEMRHILGSRIETNLLDVECVEERG